MQGLEAFRKVSIGCSATNVCAAAWAEQGRDWVRAVHNREHFLECFGRLCDKAGVAR